jgi:hypothetical protein
VSKPAKRSIEEVFAPPALIYIPMKYPGFQKIGVGVGIGIGIGFCDDWLNPHSSVFCKKRSIPIATATPTSMKMNE